MLKRMQEAAVLAQLVVELDKAGSWCGETHVQKAAYFLQEGASVPLAQDFILYKHGPFSFSLRDTLGELKADGILSMETQPYPYGPSLQVTEAGLRLLERFPKTLARYRDALDRTVKLVGSKNVNQLEKLSTALYVFRNEGLDDPEDIAMEIHRLKPHVPVSAGRLAAEEVLEWEQSA